MMTVDSKKRLYEELNSRRDNRATIMGWNGKRYEVYYGYDIRAFLKLRGFSWDSTAKCWHTENPKVAVHAIRYANPETSKIILFCLI